MTNEQYQKEILPNLPDHLSPEFIKYLRENNVVVEENEIYIIIENIKYHTPENPCHTLFLKNEPNIFELKTIMTFIAFTRDKYNDWTMVRWKASERSIKRFHVHFFKNGLPRTVDNSLAKKNNLV